MARSLLDIFIVSLVVSLSHRKILLGRYTHCFIFTNNTLHIYSCIYQQKKRVSFWVILQRMKCQYRNLSITTLERDYSNISCINFSTENWSTISVQRVHCDPLLRLIGLEIRTEMLRLFLFVVFLFILLF